MKRDPELLKKRREYIRKRIAHAQHTTKEVGRLSQELFITEVTVWRDLKG